MTPAFSTAPDWYRAAIAVQPQSHYVNVDGTQLHYVAHHSMRQVAGGWRWKFDPNLPTAPQEADGRSVLARATTRVDIVAGELSIVLSAERAQRIVATLPQGRGPIVMPQAHHHLMLDQPLALIGVLRALTA